MTGTLHGWARTDLRRRSTPCLYSELPDLLEDAHNQDLPLLVSMKWFASEDDREAWMANRAARPRASIPCRLWIFLDIDAPKAAEGEERDDAAAFEEASALWRWELEEAHGLIAYKDFVPMVSGGKGVKMSALRLTPFGLDWEAIAHTWMRDLSARHAGLVDVGMATQDVTRVPGCRHLKRKDRWQVPIPPEMRGASPKDLRELAKVRPHPLEPVPFRDRLIPPMIEMLPDPSAPPSPAFERLIRAMQADHVERMLLDEAPRHEQRTQGRARRISDWGPVLQEAGLLKRMLERGGVRLWRLTRCPACGEKDGNPYVTEAGRLYDRRTSCPALRTPVPAGSKMGGGGLPATSWTQMAKIRIPAGAVLAGEGQSLPVSRERNAGEPLPLAEAEDRLMAIVGEALDVSTPREVRVVRCTPGVGKTEAVLRTIAARASEIPVRRVIIGVESHDLARELVARLSRMLPPTLGGKPRVVHLVGRGEDNCEYPASVATLGHRGWDPAKYFCARCPSKDWCAYYKDLYAAREAPFVITTWEQAIAVIESGVCGEFASVILDEDPTRALARDLAFDHNELAALQPTDLDGGLGEPAIRMAALLMREVMDMARRAEEGPRRGRPAKDPGQRRRLRGARLHSLIEAAFFRLQDRAEDHGAMRWKDAGALLVAARAATDRIELAPGFFAPRKAEDGMSWVGGDVHSIQRFPALNTLHAICAVARDHRRWQARHGADFLGRIILDHGGGAAPAIEALTVRRPGTFLPHLILDAYANLVLYEALWAAPINVIEVEVAMPHAAFVRVPVATSRTAIVRKKGARNRAMTTKEAAAWRALNDVLDLLRAAGHVPHRTSPGAIDATPRILVLTHKPLAEMVAKRHPDVEVRHYGQGRGIDAHGDKTAAIAFGEPDIPPEDAIRLAQSIFGDEGLPLDHSHAEEHLRLWADPRIQAAVDSRREAEIAQSVHRIRPVRPPVDLRRDVVPGTPLDMFAVPPDLKVIIVIGRLDSHLLPRLIDVGPDCIRPAEGHVAMLREHGATVSPLTALFTGWAGKPGWNPTGTHYRLGQTILDLASAVTGAEPGPFEPPPGMYPAVRHIQEWEPIPAHTSIVWDQAARKWINETVPAARRLVREYDRPEPPRRWAGLRMPRGRRGHLHLLRSPTDVRAPAAIEEALADRHPLSPADVTERVTRLRSGVRPTPAPAGHFEVDPDGAMVDDADLVQDGPEDDEEIGE